MISEKDRTKEKEQELEAATTILNQLGGRRFLAMTGAYGFVYGRTEDGNVLISFRYPGSRKANKCNIELTADDLYKIQFKKFTPAMAEEKVTAEVDGIYCDQLQEVFTEYTGLYTHL